MESGGFHLLYEEKDGLLVITGHEGEGAVLDLSGIEQNIAIGKKAFLGCKSLKTVILPEGTDHIGDWAFSKCNALSSVTVKGKTDGTLFQKGVFEGCERLVRINFHEMDESASLLLATTANRMANEHLLRAEDPGQAFWYEKWDISLLSLLHTDNAESTISTAVSGEEDISYDGVGSVDGEMPGETNDYVKRIATNKCFLCYLRLRHNAFLRVETEKEIRDYLKERAFGCPEEWAWITLKEECEGDVEFLRIYLSIVSPNADTLREMIEDLNSSQVQTKALLINESFGKTGKGSVLDELFL